jgi:hypothetical protein
MAGKLDRPGPPAHLVLTAFRELLEIIRDYGMPIVAFGTGIYAFLSALQVQMAPEFKAGVASGLTLLGLLSQLWIYARENPRAHNDEVTNQLKAITDLVERLFEISVTSRSEHSGGKTKPPNGPEPPA